MDNLVNEGKGLLIDIIICIVIFSIGFLMGYHKAPVKTVYKDSAPKVTTQTKTEIQYVEKEKPTDSDIEIKQTNPTVSVNGKQYTMKKLPNETNKFDKGKVTVEQEYSIEIKAKDLIPKTPKWGMDIGYGNHGVKTGIEYNFNRNVSTYIEGTPVPKENRDRYFGAGLRVKF